MVDLNTRKPVDVLSPEDFESFPIWEYADDEEGVQGQDETWVRPVNSLLVPEMSYTHVAADFATPSGHELRGYVTVSRLGEEPEVCQGVIFHMGKGLFVSNPEAFRFRESRAELTRAVGLAEAELFPLTFRLRVPLAPEAAQVVGVLP
jgi:hypothetical protein